MSFREYGWSFSFENKYLGHLYGITEISFIVTETVVPYFNPLSGQSQSVFSIIIGRGTAIFCSHWSR